MGYPSYDLTAEQYQNRLKELQSNYPEYHNISLAVFVLGLNGEAGEVAEIFKRYYRGESLPDESVIVKELGDVLAYLTLICNELNISLETVMLSNLQKLLNRTQNNAMLGRGSDR